jgi:hypothetical protein
MQLNNSQQQFRSCLTTTSRSFHLPTLLGATKDGAHGAKLLSKRYAQGKVEDDVSLPEVPAPRANYGVRNTFIDTATSRESSLEPFCRERTVYSCPSSRIGVLQGLFKEQQQQPNIMSPPKSPAAMVSPRWMPFEVFPNTPPNDPSHFVPFSNRECGHQPKTHQLEPAISKMHDMPPASDSRPVLRLTDAVSGPDPMAAAMRANHGEMASFHQSQALTYTPSTVYPSTSNMHGYDHYQQVHSYAPTHQQQPLGALRTAQSSSCYDEVTQQSMSCVQQPLQARMSSYQVSSVCITATAPPAGPAPGSVELPSVGSAGHAKGRCKPCAFFHIKGCENGAVCRFCHICESGEKKRRAKEKLANRRKAKQATITAPSA